MKHEIFSSKYFRIEPELVNTNLNKWRKDKMQIALTGKLAKAKDFIHIKK